MRSRDIGRVSCRLISCLAAYRVPADRTLGSIIVKSRLAAVINNNGITPNSERRRVLNKWRQKNLSRYVVWFKELCTKKEENVSNATWRNTNPSVHNSTEARRNNPNLGRSLTLTSGIFNYGFKTLQQVLINRIGIWLSCSTRCVLEVSTRTYSVYCDMHAIIGYDLGVPLWPHQVAIRSSNKTFLMVARIPIPRERFRIECVYK